MLGVNELKDYNNWIGQSPADVRAAVLVAKGWANIFPEDGNPFPVWASRVRNYFNVTPTSLKLLSATTAKNKLMTMKDKRDTYLPGAHTFALSGDVYVDDSERLWFQMTPGGAVYHYEGEPTKTKSLGAAWSGQTKTPVFKLVSPDDTGGSLELCVRNPQNIAYEPWIGEKTYIGKATIGKTDEVVKIETMVVTNEIYIGTYNYSETVIRGFDEHDFRDIKPHNTTKGFYLDPGSNATLAGRRFPASDGAGKTLVAAPKK